MPPLVEREWARVVSSTPSCSPSTLRFLPTPMYCLTLGKSREGSVQKKQTEVCRISRTREEPSVEGFLNILACAGFQIGGPQSTRKGSDEKHKKVQQTKEEDKLGKGEVVKGSTTAKGTKKRVRAHGEFVLCVRLGRKVIFFLLLSNPSQRTALSRTPHVASSFLSIDLSFSLRLASLILTRD